MIRMLALAVAMLVSCQRLPVPDPLTQSEIPAVLERCDLPFLSGQWQLTHAVEATLPDGNRSQLLGVALLSPDLDRFATVLMSIEGWVMFQGRYENGHIHLEAGIAPLKTEDFASGLMEDFRLIFFRPIDALEQAGRLNDGAYVCRYAAANRRMVEVRAFEPNHWEIRQYDDRRHLRRLVKAMPCTAIDCGQDGDRIPGRIQLTAFGPFEYALSLTLIEAVRIDR